MTCRLLVILLSGASPQTLNETEVKLAIDIISHEMERGAREELIVTHEATREALVRLMNANPRIRAISVGKTIWVERK